MLKTIFCFFFALIIVALISLGATIFSVAGSDGLNATIAWDLLVAFFYATVHKLGVVSLGLAVMFYLLPIRLPRLVITVFIGFVAAIAYNYISLTWAEVSFNTDLLIYYGLFGALIGLIGGILTLRFQTK